MNQPYAPAMAQANAGLAPEVVVWRRQVKTFAIVAMVCAGCYAVICFFRIALQFVLGPLMAAYFAWLESMVPTAKLSGIAGPIQDYMARIAWVEAARNVPFLAVAIWLGVLGWKALRFDRKALGMIRVWAIFAGLAIVFSIAFQVAFILPATVAYSDALSRSMPAMPKAGSAGAPPFDIRGMIAAMTTAATAAGVVIGSLIMGCFPLGFGLWARKLLRNAPV